MSIFSKPDIPKPKTVTPPANAMADQGAMAAANERMRRIRAYSAQDTILARGNRPASIGRKTLLGE